MVRLYLLLFMTSRAQGGFVYCAVLNFTKRRAKMMVRERTKNSEGEYQVPARYSKHSIGTLEAVCPVCKTINDDNFKRDEPSVNCSHFTRRIQGGCGAYMFYFVD